MNVLFILSNLRMGAGGVVETSPLRRALYQQLSTFGPLTSLVGSRVSPLGSAQSVVCPRVIYSVQSRDDLANLDGLNKQSIASVRVEAFDESKAGARAVANAVIEALKKSNWQWESLRRVAPGSESAGVVVVSPGNPFRAIRHYGVDFTVVHSRGA